MSGPPLPVAQPMDDEVHHKISKAVSDTPNGTHSVESSGHPMAGRMSEAQPLAPKEHSQNGVICGEANASSGQEPGAEVNEEPNEGTKPSQVTPTPSTLQALPQAQATPMSPPQPPSLVQSSTSVDETNAERGANVRTAPPALVGYETLEKQDSSSNPPADMDEMETKVFEAHPMDATQDTGGASPGHMAEDKSSVGVGGRGEDLVQQKHNVREESPALVIDMGSQSETEGEDAPIIIGEPETDDHEKEAGNQVDTSSATHGSSSITQTTSENLRRDNDNVEKATSPESASSNDEDVDLEMDIIEEGEEERGETPPPLPPPLPPPKGMLVKQTTTSSATSSSISSPGHIQSLSSVHSRIGVSPSHTANRLAMESLRKGGNDAVRKPNVIVARSSTAGGGSGNSSPNKEGGGAGGGAGGGGSDAAKDRQTVVTDNFRVRQVAKVKQFFTTLQRFGNENGSEVAEQVQELITAVVNETATVEEFHQEVQSALNFPLKDFIIPFLKENLKHLRTELKESSHSLSELLGDDGPIPDTIGLTPQLVDDELPVLPSSSQASAVTIRTVSNSVITHSHQSGGAGVTSGASTSTAAKAPSSRGGHVSVSTSRVAHQGTSTSTSSSRSHQQHGTGTGTGVIPYSHSHSHSHSHSTVVLDTDSGVDHVTSVPSVAGIQRKRVRRPSAENRSSVAEKEIQVDRAHTSHVPKRPRPDHTSVHTYSGESTVTTQAPLSHLHPVPHYPQPPPIHSITSTAHSLGEGGAYVGGVLMEHGGRVRKKTLNEDWGHVQMMLSSIQGMVERARQAMVVLEDRVNATQTELEKRELERDAMIKQRVSEAVDKVKRQYTEEKQRLILEANAKLRDAVSSARNELEGRMTQTRTLAIQEALKEANVQSSSKENCWNCGRRATETCSGCNKARYCGTFCQHKDWANHMHHCASGLVGQGNAVEETYERRDNIHHHQPITLAAANEVALVSAGRGTPIRQTVAIPLSVVPGNEVNVHGIPTRIPHSHTDIAVAVVKTEKV